MRRRTLISVAVLAVSVPLALLALAAWVRDASDWANWTFQIAASVAVVTLFFGLVFPPVARWALRMGGTTGRARRSPLMRLMADLDEKD